MEQALRNRPKENFEVPSGIVLMPVNIETGLPSSENSQGTIMEAFPDESALEGKNGEERD
jgi:membrane carboxypeptidase/penicillin-binding protein